MNKLNLMDLYCQQGDDCYSPPVENYFNEIYVKKYYKLGKNNLIVCNVLFYFSFGLSCICFCVIFEFIFDKAFLLNFLYKITRNPHFLLDPVLLCFEEGKGTKLRNIMRCSAPRIIRLALSTRGRKLMHAPATPLKELNATPVEIPNILKIEDPLLLVRSFIEDENNNLKAALLVLRLHHLKFSTVRCRDSLISPEDLANNLSSLVCRDLPADASWHEHLLDSLKKCETKLPLIKELCPEIFCAEERQKLGLSEAIVVKTFKYGVIPIIESPLWPQILRPTQLRNVVAILDAPFAFFEYSGGPIPYDGIPKGMFRFSRAFQNALQDMILPKPPSMLEYPSPISTSPISTSPFSPSPSSIFPTTRGYFNVVVNFAWNLFLRGLFG